MKGEKIINIDSQAPNQIVEEALLKNKIDLGFKYNKIKREYTHGDSRFDFYLEGENKKALLEVKGVTLEKNGIVAFPDAPTSRGLKHIKGLINSKDEYLTYLLFVVQMKDVKFFTPNYLTDENFSKGLLDASNNGVKILAYDCHVRRNSRKSACDFGGKMEFRLAKEIDREKIEKIYEDGSLKLKSLGINQWQGKEKPNLHDFTNLEDNKIIYVLEDEKEIVSTLIIYDHDDDYENNLHGKWNSPKPYLALHRIATLSSQTKKGYGRKIIEFAEIYARENNFKSVRIDTHKENKSMQNLLNSLGYSYVGIVYLGGTRERFAYKNF